MESFSRRPPKPNQNMFESTMIAFPSPNSETQSAIHQTPDFHNGSALANRFKNDQFNPTSPLCWDSDSTIQSHDSEMLLFRPDQENSISHIAPAPRVGTPDMLDVLEAFDRFKDANKPPALPISELMERIGETKPEFRTLDPLPVVSRRFKSMFNDAARSIASESENIERQIERIEQKWQGEPPEALSNADLVTSEDIRIFKTLAQIFSLNAAVDVGNCVVECLSVLKSDSKDVVELQSAADDVVRDAARNKTFAQIESLRQCRSQISDLKEAQHEAVHLSRRYVDLRQTLGFQVTEIKRDRATVMLPLTAAQQTVKDAGQVHAEVASKKRQLDLEDEVREIMEVLPFTTFEKSRVTTTFSMQELRFEVAFPIRSGYPFVKLAPEVRVQIGNERNITSAVNQVCSRCQIVRKPILAVCQKLCRELQKR